MMNRYKILVFSPYFQSLWMCLIIFIFLPRFYEKYKITPVNEGYNAGIKEIRYYDDLDNDGNSERISSFFSSDSVHTIQIFKADEGLLDQWNIGGRIPGSIRRLIITDFDNDSCKEIFAFGLMNDTLRLSCFKPFEKNSYLFRYRYMADLTCRNGSPDFEISDIEAFDFNNDHFQELVFAVNSASTLQPRQIFIYDVLRDSLWFSRSAATGFNDLKVFDMNHDGTPEISGGNSASGNIEENDSIPYSDYSAWLLCYQANLKLLFPAIEYPGFHSSLVIQPFIKDSESFIAAFYNHTGPDDNHPILDFYDETGKKFKQIDFPVHSSVERYFFSWPGKLNSYYVSDQKGIIYQLTHDLRFEKSIDLGFAIHQKPQAFFDLDKDNENELLFYLHDNKQAAILREDFRNPVLFKLPEHARNADVSSCQLIERKNKNPELFIQMGDHWQTYSYRFNTLYYLKYPIYVGIYLAVLGLIFLIRYLQQLQMKERIELHNRVAELQLKSVNQQIDPHFTFNAFNSIATLLKKEKGETAYNYFMQFTDLIRMSLLTSDQIYRTLEEELRVVKNYLDIQKLRFGDRFSFEINISEEIELNRMIPKMIIQTFTENAVKHGFKETKSGGLLNIDVGIRDQRLVIAIRDNGMGRKKAGETKSESTGIGISALDKYIALLNRKNDLKIEKEIIDLYNDHGEPAGTKVVIKIPVTEE